MSFSLDAVRKYGPPLEQKVNELSKQLAKVQSENNQIETDDIVGKSDTQHSLIRYSDRLHFAKKFDDSIIGTVGPKVIFEPDYDKLKVWLKFNHLGYYLDDYSGFNNRAEIFGEPCLTSGVDVYYLGGPMNSVAHETDNQGVIYYQITDAPGIRVNGIVTGFSVCIRVKFRSFATQGGSDLALAVKLDDSTPTNAFYIKMMNTGKLRFYVRRAGVNYSTETVSPLSLNTVYDLVFTYTVSGNLLKVYVNGVEQTYTTPTALTFPTENLNLLINTRDGTTGFGDIDILDFRVYMEKVLTLAQTLSLFTNKVSISNAVLGEVAVTDGSVAAI